MTVKDLIKKQNPEELIAALIEAESDYDCMALQQEDQKPAYCVFAKLLIELRNIEPVESGRILLGVMLYEPKGEKSLSPWVYDKTTFKKERYAIPAVLYNSNNFSAFRQKDIGGYLNQIDCISYADLVGIPWSKVLGYTLVEENIKNITALDFVVAIIQEMTFLGFTEDCALIKSEEINEILKEDFKKTEKSAGRSNSKSLMSFEEFTVHLESQPFYRKHSADEKERAALISSMHVLEDEIELYRCLKNYHLHPIDLV